MPKLIVICGATATGKSGLALELAMRLDSAIISADSRQVYREFDIGTAKPSKTEQALVPHYLIDICEPRETMTVADYQDAARVLIEGKASTHLLVGGTGLYIKAITRGMKIPRVAPNYELRSHLESIRESVGQIQLYGMLEQVDPEAAAKIHPHDIVRTLRALEVYYITGVPISQQQGENPPDYPILQLGLDCDRAYLTQRIAQRTEKMVKDGFVEEVDYLCRKFGEDLPLLNTLGYQEIRQYLAGEVDLEKAKELTALHTRQFAKRQQTWFRANPQIEWFDVENGNLFEQVWQRIEPFIQNV
ncbi:tRNA (adenosine(37)-N6)-dimethylallyltransferase MiaA [Brunnivagina elsteri]|uniref:tRNA dimethylallyltransferase n=1 Tax=Brunnivagina elsteri CCALA 953 TaxID=987040 RepID=A0A2A2TEW5_9CYAN|nr:tRNA (adenosine(37)-N6)-dimethylallyltransferase MiaA [Calothrix elsteri]PAX52294.1 tRNA (adenosine(37)-N6)-dimethylallyltransferase MiaA [Calothrix elsteri CCALA 953]